MTKRYPALDVHAPPGNLGPLSWLDAVTVMVDDHAPFAVDETTPGRVRVYFTSSKDRGAACVSINSACGPRVRTHAHWVTDDDWASRSQADLRAVRVGRIIIAPPWDLPSPQTPSTHAVVAIRPALGFGSGHHATTRLALLGLQELNLHGMDVFDLGTGSGILAIAAVKLGGRRALGIDRDPDAIASAQDSVTRNNVTDSVELRSGSISELTPLTAQVVVANLTGATLTDLAPLIMTLVAPGGHLVLTGIQNHEEAAVTTAYDVHARVVWRGIEREWVGLALRHRVLARTTRDCPH